MKNILAARVAAFLIPLLIAVGLVPAANAEPPDAPHRHDNCATYPEFIKAPYGPKRSVDAYLGTEGKPTDLMTPGNRHLVAREYRTCQVQDWLVVMYRKRTMQAIQFYYWNGETRVSS